MAEDVLDTADSDALALDDADVPAKDTKKREGDKPGAPHMVLRIILGLSGILLIVGFFLPWLKLEQIASVSGMQLVLDDTPAIRSLVPGEVQRYLLLLIPGFGVGLTAVGFLGLRWSGPLAAVLGVLIVGYGFVTFIIFFFQVTGVGLWLILGGAFLSIAAGAITWARSRSVGAAVKSADE